MTWVGTNEQSSDDDYAAVHTQNVADFGEPDRQTFSFRGSAYGGVNTTKGQPQAQIKKKNTTHLKKLMFFGFLFFSMVNLEPSHSVCGLLWTCTINTLIGCMILVILDTACARLKSQLVVSILFN